MVETVLAYAVAGVVAASAVAVAAGVAAVLVAKLRILRRERDRLARDNALLRRAIYAGVSSARNVNGLLDQIALDLASDLAARGAG